MAVDKILAKNFPIYINTGSESVPVWTQIKGINSVTRAPSTATVDGRDYDSGTRLEPMVVNRGDTFTASGFRMQDETTGTRDAGQAAVETSARLVGQAARSQYQIQGPGGTTITFNANAEVNDLGGGADDLATWSATLTVVGDVTYA